MTRLEVIDGEALEPLTEAEAKALDEKIRVAGKEFADTWFELLTLLEQAEQGQIHVALGFRSWPEYLAEAVRIAPVDKNERKWMAALMSGEGMSQRAIAAVLDVDQKTVSNDLRSVEENSSTDTVGRDGKTYKREPKDTPRRRPLTDAWRDAVCKLTHAVDRLSRISEDDRFTGSRGKLMYRSDLQRAIDTLQKVADELYAVEPQS
ncbi:hypothetical protein [Mycobacterium sp. E2479]|uniref:hypothetical protein n=1 Tax=Mycobacterium sp. E2479 TaxID=1834134 RepID=UPI0007FBB8D4|nr:hypothetical protein [Mycobacterium sp. E2479]OBH54325.1 hypothetical protein A5686_08230 [Mycobacterium sp. E2479]